MFAIEFTLTVRLLGIEWEDAPWTRCLQRFETPEEADKELEWLAMEDDGYTYRVLEVNA
jgi:hypothetical protein